MDHLTYSTPLDIVALIAWVIALMVAARGLIRQINRP
jgi:hypothetical protein